MEAHAGTIGIPSQTSTPRRRRLRLLLQRVRASARVDAARVQAAEANRSLPSSIPGSEHTHLLPPKAY
jgi:hypothetical protein